MTSLQGSESSSTWQPSDDDVSAVCDLLMAGDWLGPTPHGSARNLLDFMGPIVERERRAAKVEVLRAFQQDWEYEPTEVRSITGRAMRRVIAKTYKSAADQIEAG